MEHTIEPPLPVTFMFVPDEEVGSPTSRELIEAEAARNRYVLVPEPAQDGADLITGRWAFQRFVVRARGRPAHAGATLASGRSAIREIAEQIVAIEELSDSERKVTFSVGVVGGGTFVNVVPTRCEAEVLVVTPDQAAFERARAAMDALEPRIAGVELEVEPGPVRPLFEPSAASLELYEHARSLAREIGFDPGHGSVGGGSDGNFTGSLGVPTLDGLGPEGAGFHTAGRARAGLLAGPARPPAGGALPDALPRPRRARSGGRRSAPPRPRRSGSRRRSGSARSRGRSISPITRSRRLSTMWRSWSMLIPTVASIRVSSSFTSIRSQSATGSGRRPPRAGRWAITTPSRSRHITPRRCSQVPCTSTGCSR